MSDERPRSEGGHGSTFTIELPITRRDLGCALALGGAAGVPWGVVEYANEEQGIVSGVRDVTPTSLLAFLRWLPPGYTAGVDLAEVRRRLGWLGKRPTDECSLERSGGAVKCGPKGGVAVSCGGQGSCEGQPG